MEDVAMSKLHQIMIGTFIAGVFTVAPAFAGETGTTPKHIEAAKGMSWLPRDHFRIERGRVDLGLRESQARPPETVRHDRLDLDARVWIPGSACSATSASLEVADRGRSRHCLAAADVRRGTPDWIAVAIGSYSAHLERQVATVTS
jgi:hypothetical protein